MIRWWLSWAAGLWLAIAASYLVVATLYQGFRPVWWWTTYLTLTVIVSPVCFAAYGLDKRRAARQMDRIPERTLHLLALVGGWPGACARSTGVPPQNAEALLPPHLGIDPYSAR